MSFALGLVMERAEAETCTYHVTRSAHGFVARSRDLDVGVEGATVSMAIEALRSAIMTLTMKAA